MNKTDPKSQIDKFRDDAPELEKDNDEAAFDERLKRMAQAAPKPKPEATPKDD